MRKNIFESVYNKQGFYGLQSKECKNSIVKDADTPVVLLAWRSPYALASQNEWLEKKLRQVYIQYYFKVLIKSLGLFW